MVKIKRKTLPIIIIAMLAVVALFAAGKVYAGKTWSKQAFSPDTGIAVVGFEDMYERVFAVSLPQQKVLWTIPVPKSKSVDINIEGDKVFLVGGAFTSHNNLITAAKLSDGSILWSKTLKDHDRKTPVFYDENTMYMGMEYTYREATLVKLYALDKSTGREKWIWPEKNLQGTLRQMFQAENGDFVLIVQVSKKKPDGTGIVNTAYLVKVSREDGQQVWHRPIDGSFATDPSVSGGAIYFTTQKLVEGKVQYTFQAVNAENGEVKFTYNLPEGKTFGKMEFFNEYPLLITTTGTLYCFDKDATDSSNPIRWEKKLEGLPDASPMVSGDKVFSVSSTIGEGNIKTNFIAAFNGESGEQYWSHTIKGSLEPPFLIDGDRLLAASRYMEGEGENQKRLLRVVGLDISNGAEVWKNEKEGKLENPIFIKENILYVMMNEKLREEGKDPKDIRTLSAYKVEDGSNLWTYTTESVITTQLYIDDDSVDFGTKSGYVVSLDKSTGQVLYRNFAGDNNELDTDIISKDGFLGFATQDGEYYILDKSGKTLKAINMVPWFADWKIPVLVGCILLSAAISWYIYHARKGKELFVRRIAGLQAIDEAVGRSTEMGKPVLYITGLADVDDIQTLASLSILGHIAQKTAEYDTPLVVPCCRSVVMSTAQEVVKESYLKAGRPDTYRSENIHYLTDDQFGYVAGVDGIMVREKPAANFYMGKFYAESLILAETGHSTGAIQIAGTAEAAQLPFFVAACDYTLIGEELFAASAYLSKDPLQIGSLKGQDMAKAIILLAITIGCILMSLDLDAVKSLFATR